MVYLKHVRLERNAQRNGQRSSPARDETDNLLPKAIQGQKYDEPDIVIQNE